MGWPFGLERTRKIQGSGCEKMPGDHASAISGTLRARETGVDPKFEPDHI
jgi:hypothetical protein